MFSYLECLPPHVEVATFPPRTGALGTPGGECPSRDYRTLSFFSSPNKNTQDLQSNAEAERDCVHSGHQTSLGTWQDTTPCLFFSNLSVQKRKKMLFIETGKIILWLQKSSYFISFLGFLFFFYPINPTVDSEDSRADGLLWWHRDSSCFSLVESPPLVVLPA